MKVRRRRRPGGCGRPPDGENRRRRVILTRAGPEDSPILPTMSTPARRFVQYADAVRETNPWANVEWLCRPDVVAAENLLLVRASIDPMYCHPFHHHPHREEIIYVLYGRAEQWVGTERRILAAGDVAHIPAGVVHATYNPHPEPLVFLAILSPVTLPAEEAAVPDPFDVSGEEPWASLRLGLPRCRIRS